jgi:hypothetical protein
MKVVIIYVLLMAYSFAADLSVEVSPKEPIAGEPFSLIFKLKTNSSEDPDISFNPSGAEVVGRQNQGISIKTMYINGRLVTSKETVYTYELIAARPGNVRVSDIQVDIGSEKIRNPNLMITILKEPKQSPDIFAMAITDKNKAFVGEGITVRYYLYYKTGVTAVEIKEFPKLNRFTKRFLQEMDQPERVNFEGEVYYRQLKYSARLFTDKEGKYIVDPITLRVQFQERGQNDPFGGFGLGMRVGRMATRNVSSKSSEITVERLPADSVPPHFTGLVGKHHFELTTQKTKFLVNEPIELKLTVTGPGNLENFDEPKLINDPALEEFETNADLKIDTDISATKTFTYTFLGRGKTETKAATIPFSYFNPENGQYVTANINMPAIIVEGEGYNAVAPTSTPVPETPSLDKVLSFPQKTVQVPREILAPLFQLNYFKNYTIKIINGLLVLLIISILGFYYFKNGKTRDNSALAKLINQIKKEGLSYNLVYETLNLTSLELEGQCITDVSNYIKSLNISNESKNYFSQTLSHLEKKEFYEKKSGAPITFNQQAFNELLKLKKKIS